MRRVLEFLSHPAWQGFGAICGAAGCLAALASLYFVIFPITPVPSTSTVQHEAIARNSGNGTQTPDATPTGPVPNDPQSEVDRIIANSLGSIGPNYRGMHQYFNDGSLLVPAVILALLGVGALISNWIARRSTGKTSQT